MRPGKDGDYFDLAGSLRQELEGVDGFISVERFRSVNDEARYVSISFWRDEAAVKAWRDHAGHRLAQARGKESIFADFRIRVAEVIRDYSLADTRT